MLDELKEEANVNKVGGRFKLATLIQRRMVALNRGARPLVQVRGGDHMAIVIQEILQGKIYLDLSGQLQTDASQPAREQHLPPGWRGGMPAERTGGSAGPRAPRPASCGDLPRGLA
jgi:DNA-directed RNA polymerase subunit omega